MLIELDYPSPKSVELDAQKTLLLIIDMENENAHPEGALFIGDPVKKIIPNIAKLRARVRQAGGRVVHTQSVRSPGALEFTVFKNTVRKLEGTWGSELIDELKPAADEPLIVKHTHDSFYRTELDAQSGADGTVPRRRAGDRDRHFHAQLCTKRGDGVQRPGFPRLCSDGLHSA
jgi:isochorismate hydrolase